MIKFASLTLLKYALLMNPLARSIEELLPPRIANSYACFILLRTALVVSSVCVAFLLPFFGNYVFFKFSVIGILSFLESSQHNGLLFTFILSIVGLMMALIGSLLSILVVSAFS